MGEQKIAIIGGRNAGKNMAVTIALLEELDRYRASGTAEECRKAVEKQIKLKEYIERINQPEYNDVVWKKDEVVLMLKELIAV